MNEYQKVKKISIVTPCFNSEKYIRETVESVIFQKAVLSRRVELEYIICDGASTDKTLEIIASYNSPHIKVISEQDKGMYDALSKGLSLISGEICAYLNAGDYYSQYAFDIVLDIFEREEVKWLTGFNVYYNENSYLVNVKLPFRYRTRFIQCGLYGIHLPFIQQESTFWRNELTYLVDLDRLKSFKLAGDYYLWYCFSKKYNLYIIEAYIGGFKIHKGQLSERLDVLKQEIKSFSSTPGFFDYMVGFYDRLTWFAMPPLKKLLNKKLLLRYNHDLQKWD